jgi:hypothetical protein
MLTSYFLIAIIGTQISTIEVADKQTCQYDSSVITAAYEKDKQATVRVFCLPRQIKE